MKFLILPGLGGSDSKHWQTLWESEDPDFVRVEQKSWDNPSLSDWQQSLEAAIEQHGSDSILLAHSLGCLLVAHWATSSALSCRGAFLVGVPNPNAPSFPSVANSFGGIPYNLFAFKSLVIASADDPYAQLDFSQKCAQSWGSQFHNIGKAGHINSESGIGDWPQGYRLLERLVIETET